MPTAALELDDLVEELHRRAEAAARDQSRLAALLDAVLAVTSDLKLTDVLNRIVKAACELVDAEYGALGVIGLDGKRLVEFVSLGMSEHQVAAMGEQPCGRGVLGLLIDHPVPLRIEEVSAHPAFHGFPANHPPMHSFLGVPVRVRGQAFGNLYLTQKVGGAQFTPEDETVLVAHAAAAGVAIENARLYESARNGQRWSEATGELRQMLFEGSSERKAMNRLAEISRMLAGADLSVVVLFDGRGDLVVTGCDARGLGNVTHSGVLEAPEWGLAIAAGTPLLVDDSPSDAQQELLDDICGIGSLEMRGSTAVLPIKVGSESFGALTVSWDSVESGTVERLDSLSRLADQTGLALLAARTRSDRSRLALLEDRDRIARDMHDHVIQRLFATGLSLQSTSRLRIDSIVRERLDEAVGELDEAIKDIRRSIFELQRRHISRDIIAEIAALVHDVPTAVPQPPTLEIRGEIDDLPADVLTDLLAVLRESLSNVSRHAQASAVDVRIDRNENELAVVVTDDGVGVRAHTQESGLANLRHRAGEHGGELRLSSRNHAGTVLTWRVPLAPSRGTS